MNIIPKPLSVKELSGTIPFGSTTVVSGNLPAAIAKAKELLSTITSNKASKLIFLLDDKITSEGYKIACAGDTITVTASTEKGAYYALMTLSQLSEDKNTIPAVQIEDAPKYAYRGFMLDVARHFFTVDKVKELIDNMSKLKFNYFHWHLSEDQGWRVEIKKYPKLTEQGSIRKSTPITLKGYNHKDPSLSKIERDDTEYGRGMFYTQVQLKEVVAYAKERHVEVYPEIDMPGHLVAAISCYPNLSCSGNQMDVSTNWGVMDDIGCCGKEDIYTFTKNIIDELVEIFDCKYFHIGGDEVPKTKWKKCPSCQAKIKELGLKDENALQGHFNKVISEYLKTKGKTMIGWNEVLEADNLGTDIVVQWWTTTNLGHAHEHAFMGKGGKVILSMCPLCYMDHAFAMRPLSKTYTMTAKTMRVKDKSSILGVEAPQWTEYIRDVEKLDFNTYARLATMSEVAWTSDELMNYHDFENRLENLRGYFAKRRIRLAPKFYYQGKSCFAIGRVATGNAKWRENSYFELELAKKKGMF